MVFSYAGTGRMPQFVAVKALGLISYSYTSAIEEQFLYLDFGALGRAYWVIADHASKVIEDYKDDQIVDLVESGGPLNQVDYGSITEVEAYATDDWGEITVTSNIQAMGRTHFHSLTTWSVIKTWVGSGTVFEFGGSRYRLDAPYIVSGTLWVAGNANTHYVPAIATEGLLPLRSDTKVAYAPNWNAFGTLFSGSFAGEAVTKVFPEDPDYTIRQGSLTTLTAADLSSGYGAVYDGSVYRSTSGAGTTSTNGFAVGPHVRFGTATDPGSSSSTYRKVEYDLDLTGIEEITFRLVMGNGSNGGETPDNSEDLWMRYLDTGLSNNDASRKLLDNAETTYTTPGDKTVTVPVEARRPNQTIRIYQLTWTGTYEFDHYGFISLSYGSEVVVGGDGDQRNNLFNVVGNASVSFRPNWVGSGVLFSFSTTTFKQTYDYVGEGTLFGFSSTEERVVWDYNNSSIDYFTYENFGSVAESPIESITIQSIANETIQSRANERIIDLVVAGSTSGAFLDFGTILTDGEQTPSTVGLDWGHILTNQTDYPFGLFPISGTAKQVFTPNFVGSGGLFAFVNGRGRTKPRWIAFVNIGIFGASKTNFSLLHEGSGSLFSINNADDSRAYAYRGSGALYAFSGAAEAVGFNPPEDTAILPLQGAAGVAFAPNWIAEGTVKTEGTAVERQTDHYKGSGTLFNFETAVEKITYHYSSTSNDIFQYRNYGSVADQPIESITIQSIANETIESRKDDRIIDLVVGGTTSGSYLDYGPILLDGEDAPETVREDYGSIMESVSRYAMGDLLVHGTAAVRREFSYVGKGDLFAFIEGRGRTKPRWIANVNIEVSGEGQDAVVKRFIGDGNLFNFEKAEERRTFGYEGQGTFSTSGEASIAYEKAPYRAFVLFDVTGDTRVAFVPNFNGSGVATIDVGHVERTTFSEVGSGVLFDMGNLVERRTYHYSHTSDTIFTPLDYGSVAVNPIDSITIQSIANDTIESRKDQRIIDLVTTGSTSGSYFDYGSVSDFYPSITDDYEGITETVTRYAMGGPQISGAADVNFRPVYVGSGDISINISTIVRVLPRWIAFVPIDFTGAATDTFTKAYKGSGIVPLPVSTTDTRSFAYEGKGELFAINGGEEAFTFDYPKPDHDLVIRGNADVAYVPNWNGSGTATITGQVGERVAYDQPGTGFLFNFSNAIDRRTYHYNSSSIDLLNRISYGSVASPVIDSWVIADHANKVIQDYRNDKLVDLVEGSGGDYFDYGFLEQENIGGLPNINTPDATEDYQFIIDPELGASRYPFGVLFRHFESEVVIGISLRHIAVNTEPTVKIGGKVFVKLPNKHQGEGTLFNTGGAAETATFREVKDGLFEFVGFAATRRIPNFNGGGTVRLDGASSSAVAFAGFQENTIVLRGVATVKYTPSYTGTGFISTLSGAAEAITASPDDLFGLFDFVGTAAERTSAAHLGSGSLFALSGAVEAVAVAEDKRNLLKISGNAGERFIPNFNGSGTLSVLSGAAESRTASPDDLFTLFDFTGRGTVRATIAESGFALLSVFGTTEPEVLTFAEQPFGTATISGNAGEKFVPNWIGSGTIATLSGAAESATFNPLERQILFSMGGIATEVFAAAPAIDGAEIKLSGTTSPEIRTFAEQPFGVIPVSGIAEVINVDVYLAEGTLFSGGFTSESVTFKIPPVRDGDILFRGSAVEAVGFNPPEETAHLLLSGEVVIPLRTFAEQPTVRVAISGVAIEKNTEAYLGTGVIFSNGFTSESVTRKLPEFTAHLNVTGLAEERATFREIFFGSLFKFRGSAGRALLTFAERPQTLSKISGVAATTRARDFVGEGNIATLSGAAEAVTFNPLERDLLFDVTGIAAERRTNVFVGSGQIKVYPEAADIRFIPNWNAEGVIPVSGTAVERVARDEVVQVNIGTFSGAAESVTFNPLEKDMLFSVGGRAAYRTSVSEVKLANARLFADDNNGTTTKIHVGSGTATLSGAGRIVITLSYVGDIRIGTFSGAAEAVTFNPLEKDLLFSASGIATLRSTRAYSGTGSLFAINGAAESRTVVPPADGLYAINGEANIVITLSHVGDGSLFSFVKGAESFTYDYVGEQVLFDLSGEAVERITNAYAGSGSIFSIGGAAERVAFAPSLLADVNISGVAATPRSRVFTGSGDLYAFGGAAESRTITYENVAIFDFLGQVKPAVTKAYVGEAEIEVSGAAAIAFVRAPYPGQADVQLSGTAAESTTANPPEEGTEIATSGEAKVLRSFGYEGSGQLKVHGDTIIGISLRIFGTGSIKVDVRTRYFPLLQHRPDVHIYIAGSAATVKIDVAPPRTYGWII